ncbi:DUF2829 domain-containing protein [Xenorhabdus khoisanae]|uniref:Thoeris anti-defense Tad2 family protein n=1 Tax=Xenorhabdus khoisanae TaxID=880157 RepID=UPI002359AD25|nr:MW1434 family type I TA system toxin [Xenorhabdus khoisanae]MDC9614697.1 DUF2829 domain-containing protein [Xenorhabdus khoisanae]
MSEVNKPDNKQCPFNPELYKSHEIAPIGSFPWAMIQVYLGGRVHRRGWDVADAYIRLLPASGGFKPLLEKYDKEDGPTIWTPTQDDMVGCDWELLKEDNKPEIKCPFNPRQYNLAAIVGSLPWALIQVYLGNKAYRTDWHAPDEYIHLVYQSGAPGGGVEDTHIEIMHKPDHFESWTPTQEDLIACDWKLLKSEEPKPKPKPECPEGTMVSFDLEIGKVVDDLEELDLGFLADHALVDVEVGPFGALTNLQNKTDIKKILQFTCAYIPSDADDDPWVLDLRVSSDNNDEGHKKMVELFKKTLTVTVDGVSYELKNQQEADEGHEGLYDYDGMYQGADVPKLGVMMKQNVGKILRFCLNWK